MNYIVKSGERFEDVVLNSTGSLDNYELILNANNFDTWTPDLFIGQSITIPDSTVNQTNNLRVLSVYPACNQIQGLDDQIEALIDIFEASIIIPISRVEQIIDTNKYYTAKQGETISDIVLNTTGSILNWGLFLDANGFDCWTPEITEGQKIFIPSNAFIQSDALGQLEKYPSCNNSEVTNLDFQINALIRIFAGISSRADNNTTAKADSIVLTADINM